MAYRRVRVGGALASVIARKRRDLAFQAGGLFALGATIESLQGVINAANVEWWDIRDDGYGIVALTIIGQLRIIRKILLKDEPPAGVNSVSA